MRARTVRHQHRHFKTLIVLVLSMTGSTLLLFWVGGLAPVTPLRGKTPDPRVWRRLAVRAEQIPPATAGFFHFRISRTGELVPSRNWQMGQEDPRTPGTIQILLACRSPEKLLGPSQAKVLADLISRLRADYDIGPDQVYTP